MATLHLDGKSIPLSPDGRNLLEIAEAEGLRLPASCGGYGSCHECILRILEGADGLTPPTAEEAFLREGYRLACQCAIAGPDSEVTALSFRRAKPQIVIEGLHREVALDPMVSLRDGQVYYGDDRIAPVHDGVYGIAADIGTTTVVVNLIDLETGRLVARASFENPQVFGGRDVTNRIRYDGEDPGHELHRVLMGYLNNAVAEFPVDRESIYELVLAGNATMRDLALGLDVQTLGVRPFKSRMQQDYEAGQRASTSVTVEAASLGLTLHPRARVYAMPLIGCHVGADTAACLLTAGLHRRDEIGMLIDIGTNTEIVLGNRQRLIAASCPAGPAFEGGAVSSGMPGLEGAIETIHLRNGEVVYHVIGNSAPLGICGSGLIDLLAELLRTGRMTETGRYTGEAAGKPFPVAPDHGIVLRESDISLLAQAKAANYAGQRILLEEMGLGVQDVERFHLAGGFARYINAGNAIAIGMLPNVPLDRIVKLGNAAIEGATEALLSRDARREIEAIVQQIEHVELEAHPAFFETFVDGCLFQTLD